MGVASAGQEFQAFLFRAGRQSSNVDDTLGSLMNYRLSRNHLGFLLLAGATPWACAKAEDVLPDVPGGIGGTLGTPSTNTTTVTNTSATASNSTATSTTGSGGAPGAAGETGDTGSGGTGGVPQDVIDNAEIVLLYKVDDSKSTSMSIFTHLYLRNQSNDEFPLGAAEVRYWFDSDGLSYTLASHYQGPAVGPVTLTSESDDGEEYISIIFEEDATLPPRTSDINSTEFQLKLDASGGSFDQSNDYSFAPELNTPTEHLRVTVYLAGKLVWGCEPSGTCAKSDPGAGGAAGAAGAAGADSQ